MSKIFLPWMNELRRLSKISRSDELIISGMYDYGLAEEKRINDSFDDRLISVNVKEGCGMSEMAVEIAKSLDRK